MILIYSVDNKLSFYTLKARSKSEHKRNHSAPKKLKEALEQIFRKQTQRKFEFNRTKQFKFRKILTKLE